jgi:hypothetical protein
MGNRRLVALTCAVLGLLTTPTHTAQKMPQCIGMVVDLKLFANYLGDPLQGPQFGSISGGLGTLQ